MKRPAEMSRVLFHLTAAMTTVFVITILTSVAVLLGDPEAPINIWFNRHSAALMAAQVVCIVVFGLAAMTADRRETLRSQASTFSIDAAQSEQPD
jgi:hypothetical protein